MSDDPLSSSTFFDPLLRTGARDLKRMKWRRICRGGVSDEVVSFVLRVFPTGEAGHYGKPRGSTALVSFLVWVQASHWRGPKKIKYIGAFGDGKGPLLGLLRSPIFFLFDPVFSLHPPPPPPPLSLRSLGPVSRRSR